MGKKIVFGGHRFMGLEHGAVMAYIAKRNAPQGDQSKILLPVFLDAGSDRDEVANALVGSELNLGIIDSSFGEEQRRFLDEFYRAIRDAGVPYSFFVRQGKRVEEDAQRLASFQQRIRGAQMEFYANVDSTKWNGPAAGSLLGLLERHIDKDVLKINQGRDRLSSPPAYHGSLPRTTISGPRVGNY